MQEKAQAEFALILGLIIIAVAIGLFAFSAIVPISPQPSALTGEQKAVDTYIKDAMRRASSQTLISIYNQGGYLNTDSVKSLDYAGSKIPYWEICGRTNIPDIERIFEQGILDSLKESLPDRTDIAGEEVVFDKSLISVDAQLFDNKIALSVEMPTTVKGQAMPQPYAIDVATKLGRIYEFAKNFARNQAVYRMLETNLIRMMYRSNPDPRACWLPTGGAVTGYSFRKSWAELRGCMEELIIHTLSHTYAWEKPALKDGRLPTNMLDKSWMFEVLKEGGEWGQYADLDVTQYYGGDEKRLSRSNPELFFNAEIESGVDGLMELIRLISTVVMIKPFTPYEVSYDVSFPVVMSAYDSILERSFKFTTFVNIKDNTPSYICSQDMLQPDVQYRKCYQGAVEPMGLTVLNFKNEPLSGVNVRFDGCGPWVTAGGNLQVNIPRSRNAVLSLLHPYSLSEYSICADYDELASKTLRMPLVKKFDVTFYQVKINKQNYATPQYEIYQIVKSHEKVVANLRRIGNRCMPSDDFLVTNDRYGSIRQTGVADIAATEVYNATIISTGVGDTLSGYMETDEFTIDYADGHIYIYSPSMTGFIDSADTDNLKKLYSACGIEPVTATDYLGPGYSGPSKVGCSYP